MFPFSGYILYSSVLDRYDIGSTENVERRLSEHNSGVYAGSFTTRGIPWVLYLEISGLNSHDSYAIEKHIKRMKSKKYIKVRLFMFLGKQQV